MEDYNNMISNCDAYMKTPSIEFEAIKAKIISHPRCPNLVQAYIDCQKVGAAVDVAAEVAMQEFQATQQRWISGNYPTDPELDEFMEAYHGLLVKYREEVTRPTQEAMEFIARIHSQLPTFNSAQMNGDGEVKTYLLKKYSGCLGSLKQELSKKKTKAKLPKESRRKLLTWWDLHSDWPYPSESEKVALAESTGLGLKQINNWFINQRKRHWKPSLDSYSSAHYGLRPMTRF